MTTDDADEKLANAKKATTKQNTEIIAEAMITFLNLLNTCIAERAGRIIKLDISRAPIILIPITTVIAVKKANIIL